MTDPRPTQAEVLNHLKLTQAEWNRIPAKKQEKLLTMVLKDMKRASKRKRT